MLALVLLPIFVIPARRMGARMAELQREAADAQRGDDHSDDRAVLRAGRHAGQTLRPAGAEAAEFGVPGHSGARHRRPQRDVAPLFLTALTLVSALAQALVYGLGGWLALRGQLAAGHRGRLALLLTRLYSPLTALANARVDVMTALVAFERVFEVLDVAPDDH